MEKLSRILCLSVLAALLATLCIYAVVFSAAPGTEPSVPPEAQSALSHAQRYSLRLTDAGLEVRVDSTAGALLEVVPINSALVPAEELEHLRKGVFVEGLDRLSALLEDYAA